MADGRLEIDAEMKDRVSGVLDNIKGKLKGVGGVIGDVAKTAAGFALGQGITAAPGLLFDMAQAAADDAASLAKLKQAVDNSGVSYDSQAESIQRTIDLAQKRAFTDDQARDALSLLTAQTGSASEAQKRFGLAMDLSRGANIDLNTASKLLGKVTTDNVNVLAKYGIKVKEGTSETELFGIIQQKFGGQSEAFAESTAGHFAQVKIQMSELKEKIGYALLPVMAALGTFLVAKLIPAANRFTDWLGDKLGPYVAQAKLALGGFIAALSGEGVTSDGLVGKAEQLGVFIRDVLVPAAKDAAEWIQTKLVPALLDIGAFIVSNVMPHMIEFGAILKDVIVAVITDFVLPALKNLKRDWDAIWPVLRDYVIPALEDVGQFLLDHKEIVIGVATVVVLLVAPWLAVVAAIVILLAYQQQIEGFFTSVYEHVDAAIAKVREFPIIGEIIQGAFDSVILIVTAGFETILGIFKVQFDLIEGVVTLVLDLIHGDFGKFWTDLKALLGTMFEDVKGIFSIQLDLVVALVRTFVTETLPGVFGDAATLLKSAGEKIAKGLFDGVKAGFYGVGKLSLWLAGLPGEFVASIPSPHALLYGIGGDIIDGLFSGMKSAWEKVTGGSAVSAASLRKSKARRTKTRNCSWKTVNLSWTAFATAYSAGGAKS